jgi:hypothetical protein
MKRHSIHNARLKLGDYSWVFEVFGRAIRITQTFQNRCADTVEIHEKLLPAFISHLVKGMQQLREVQRRERDAVNELLNQWKVTATKR